jgi:hypothetical protein
VRCDIKSGVAQVNQYFRRHRGKELLSLARSGQIRYGHLALAAATTCPCVGHLLVATAAPGGACSIESYSPQNLPIRRWLLVRQRRGAIGSARTPQDLDGCGNENKNGRDPARANTVGAHLRNRLDRGCPETSPARHVPPPSRHASAWRKRRANRRPRTRVSFLRRAGPVLAKPERDRRG